MCEEEQYSSYSGVSRVERERERGQEGKRARGNRHENSMSQASSTDVPSEQDKHDADHELSECPTCGSRLASLFPKVSGVDAAEREDAEKQKRSTSTKQSHKPRGPYVKQGILKEKAARLLVRKNMLVCIPGISHAKAQAGLNAFKGGTLTEIMRAERQELCGLGEGRAKLTAEDAEAIQRVLH